MATEDLVRVVAVCSQGMGKRGHVEASLCALEERKHAEYTAAVAAVVAPCFEAPSTLLSIVKATFRAAWRGKATRASFALRSAPAFSYVPRICMISEGSRVFRGVQIPYSSKRCSEVLCKGGLSRKSGGFVKAR